MSNNTKNLPEVKLGQYKGLAVTRHVRPLSEKTIDQEMVHQTRMRSVYHNSTAPAKRGSRVLLDFVGFMDGEEIPDSRMEKVMVVLGDGKLMPALSTIEGMGDGAADTVVEVLEEGEEIEEEAPADSSELPAYTADMSVEEICSMMSYEEAGNVIVPIGTCKGWTLAQVSDRRPASLKWYINGYSGNDNILRAAATIMQSALDIQKAS